MNSLPFVEERGNFKLACVCQILSIRRHILRIAERRSLQSLFAWPKLEHVARRVHRHFHHLFVRLRNQSFCMLICISNVAEC